MNRMKFLKLLGILPLAASTPLIAKDVFNSKTKVQPGMIELYRGNELVFSLPVGKYTMREVYSRIMDKWDSIEMMDYYMPMITDGNYEFKMINHYKFTEKSIRNMSGGCLEQDGIFYNHVKVVVRDSMKKSTQRIF